LKSKQDVQNQAERREKLKGDEARENVAHQADNLLNLNRFANSVLGLQQFGIRMDDGIFSESEDQGSADPKKNVL